MKKTEILNFIQDSNGNNSSKRLGGAVCLIQGSLMKLGLFIYAINHETITSFERLDGSVDSLIFAGSALLGWGVFERITKSDKKKC
ncbi:MAG: hypothetical protein ACI9TO_000237 [Rickettsiales bacterium]|jgi:hypothetical protein